MYLCYTKIILSINTFELQKDSKAEAQDGFGAKCKNYYPFNPLLGGPQPNADKIQVQFRAVQTRTKMHFIKDDPCRNRLLELYGHMLMKEEKDNLKAAKAVDICGILGSYWNHVDYSLLEHNINAFGTRALQDEMKKYTAELKQFEQVTTVQEYNLDAPHFPEHFITVTIIQDKDPTQCKLCEVRQFKNELLEQSSLKEYAILTKISKSSSVEVVLAFPPHAFMKIHGVVLSAEFQTKHKIRKAPAFSHRAPYDLSTTDCDSQRQGMFICDPAHCKNVLLNHLLYMWV